MAPRTAIPKRIEQDRRSLALALVLIIALLACLLTACGSRLERSELRPVRLVMTSQVHAQLPVVLAEALGYYEQQGLAVRIENVQSNTKAVHALSGGSADVCTGTLGQVFSLASDGREVKAFSTMLVGSQLVLVATPTGTRMLRTVRDLRGAAVGVGGLGGPANQFLNWILVQNGVSPADVTTLSIGTLASAVAAVEHSKVDAATLNTVEYLMLRKRGFTPVMLVDTRGRENTKRCFGTEEYPTSMLIATGSWLRQNAETARRLARAINQSARWMHQHSAEQVVDRMPARYRGDRDIDVQTISSLLPMFSQSGRIAPEGAEAVRRVVSASSPSLRISDFDVSKTYTNEFVEEQ